MERNPNEIVEELCVFDILSNRPCGMTLPEIGNEMGVNWRGLADTMCALISEGSIEKLGNRYYRPGNNEEFIGKKTQISPNHSFSKRRKIKSTLEKGR